jgi:hypothetical protein
MNEEKIKAVVSAGAECFWCEKKIPVGDGCDRIEFNVKIPLLGSTTKHEFAHADCGEGLGWLWIKRAKEARELGRR